MSEETNKSGSNESDKPKSLETIVEEQIDDGTYLYRQTNNSMFLSSLSAGMDIGFSVLFITVLNTIFSDYLPKNVVHAISSIGYPIGFIMVIIGKSVLFTEQTTMSALPVFRGKKSLIQLMKLWGFVLLGNLVGGIIMALFIAWIAPELNAASPKAIVGIAKSLMSHSNLTIFGSAVLAGWVMGMLSWLTTSSQETISRVFLIIGVTYFIGIAYLHHSIVGSIEIFSAMLISAEIGILDYFNFLFFAVIGNAVGGIIFVAIMKYKALET